MEPKKPYQRFTYTQKNLEEAVYMVQHNSLGLNAAAKQFGVPKSTLSKKVRGLVPIERKMGPDTVLNKSEEEKLCKWILSKAKLGFPMHHNEVLNTVQNVIKETNRENHFTDGRPGKKWLQLFLNRHPEIKKRNTEIISKARASVTEEAIHRWFQDFEDYLKEEKYEEIMTDPTRIFNADEMGVQFCPKSGKLLGPRTYKNFYEISSGPEKESVTVLCNYSASGLVVPPMLVLPYKRIPRDVANSIPDGYFVGRSDSGWMISETFFEYLSNCFHPWLLSNAITLPVILLLDGHKSHINIETANFCRENGIILYCLHPNSTHILQPCDVSIFKPIKGAWKKVVLQHKQRSHNYITKVIFAPLFKQAFDQATSVDTIINGFKICGLFPFDRNAVDYEKCISVRREAMKTESLNVDDFRVAVKVLGVFSSDLTEKFSEKTFENINDNLYKFWNFCNENLLGGTLEEEISDEVIIEEGDNNLLKAEEGKDIENYVQEDENNFSETFLDSLPMEFEDIVINPIFDDNIVGDVQITNYELDKCDELVKGDLPIINNQKEVNNEMKTDLDNEIQSSSSRNSNRTEETGLDDNINKTAETESNIIRTEEIGQERDINKIEETESVSDFHTDQIEDVEGEPNTNKTEQIGENDYNKTEEIARDRIINMTERMECDNRVKSAEIGHDSNTNQTTDIERDSSNDKIEETGSSPNIIKIEERGGGCDINKIEETGRDNTVSTTDKSEKIDLNLDVTPDAKACGDNTTKKEKKNDRINVLSNIVLRPHASDVWDKHLHWPKLSTKKANKRTNNCPVPFAITSDKWKQYYMEKDTEKQQKEEKKEDREKLKSKKRENTEVDGVRSKKTKIISKPEDAVKKIQKASSSKNAIGTLGIGDHVLVKYDENFYPGIITAYDNYNEYEIKVMEKTPRGNWRWPEIADQIWYKKTDILKKIDKPVSLNSRGIFKILGTN